MRISDWSSDVCSSDLLPRKDRERIVPDHLAHAQVLDAQHAPSRRPWAGVERIERSGQLAADHGLDDPFAVEARGIVGYHLARSEARCVGKEWGSTCRSRWAACIQRKKHKASLS